MDTLKKLQAIQIESLKEIIRICEAHGLTYYLWYGSMLGAVRHDGFIPWDDDLDLAMPEEDYDKFIECCKTELKPEFFLHTFENDPNYFPAFVRIRRNNTTYIPEVYNDTNFLNNGVWVDIFPLHYAKSDRSTVEKIKFNLQRRVLRPLISIRALGAKSNKTKSKIAYALVRHMKLSTLIKWNEKVAKFCPKQGAKFLTGEGNALVMSRYYYKAEDLGEGSLHKFESLECRIPNNPDILLKMWYGDYMQLPPENERVGHIPTKCDLSQISIDV